MSFKNLFYLILIFIPALLSAQIKINVNENSDHVLINITSLEPFNKIAKESLTGSETVTIFVNDAKGVKNFSQHTFNNSFIKYFIQQQLVKNQIQFVLKHGKNKFSFYINTYADSIFNCDIHIFNKLKENKISLALFLKAVEYHKKNDLTNAINFYRKSIKKNAQNGNAYFKAGQIRLLKKETKNSIINFTKAVKFKTDSIKAHYYLSVLYKKNNKPKLAKKHLAIYKEKIRQIVDAKKKIKLFAKSKEKENSLSENKNLTISPSITTKIVYAAIVFAIIMLIAFIIIKKFNNQDEEKDWNDDSFEEEQLIDEKENTGSTEMHVPSKLVLEEEASIDEYQELYDKSIDKNIERNQIDEANKLEVEKINKAKNLKLGVGELDLALSIRSKIKSKKRLAGKEEFIIEMYNQGFSIDKIAKELNLNYGEVDLVIGLNKHRVLKQ